MTDFLFLFREPDGRTEPHTSEFTAHHQRRWTEWLAPLKTAGQLKAGSALSLDGVLVAPDGTAAEEIYRVGQEIVGGFLLLAATDLAEATALAKTCPVLEAGGTVEVRAFQ